MTIQPTTGGPWLAVWTVYDKDGTARTAEATAYPGQVAQGSFTMDSQTGRIGTVVVDVFDVS